MLHLVDETFNQMPLTIHRLVILSWLFAIASRWYDNLCAALFETFQKIFRIIPFISDEQLEVKIFDKFIGLRLIVTLTSRQEEAQGIA